ncbi:hypothetical protein LBMAG42_51910 [Deltaproteobacteria bacterium]|nr:hypothetical protein LBMAG42_51910 [Deltaproteobacteria bacterium]
MRTTLRVTAKRRSSRDLAPGLSMHEAVLEPGVYAIMSDESEFPSFPDLMGFGKLVYETPPCRLLLVTADAVPDLGGG